MILKLLKRLVCENKLYNLLARISEGGSVTQKNQQKGEIKMHGRLVAHKISHDGSDAVRVADDQGQSVTADIKSDGEARYEVAGRSRQNEEGVLQVCQILALKFRRNNGNVGEPRMAIGPEGGVDCEIPTPNEVLHVQVTRPMTPEFWQRLNHDAIADRNISFAKVADDVLAMVKAKAQKTNRSDRAHIVLALDATETTVHAMPSVAKVVRQQCGAVIAKHGFKAVWIVGPSDNLVFRMDEVSS